MERYIEKVNIVSTHVGALSQTVLKWPSCCQWSSVQHRWTCLLPACCVIFHAACFVALFSRSIFFCVVFTQHLLLHYFHVAFLPCDKDSAWACCVRGERLAWVALVSRKKRSCVIYTQHCRCCEKDSACKRQRVTAENATKFSCGRV